MSQSNLISAEIPEQVKSEILTKLAEVSNLLANTLIFNLTGQERMEMYKMGDEGHLRAMQSMQELMKSPESMSKWFESKRKEFEALPENK